MENKVIFITGGSGAIGSAIAKTFLSEENKVIIGGRDLSKLRAIQKQYSQIDIVQIDVSNFNSITLAISQVIKRHSKIDILVNCAGGGARNGMKFLHEQEVSVIEEIIKTNLLGSILISRQVIPYMIENNFGRIINIGSVIGIGGRDKYSEYSAAKAGLIGFTKSLAIELGQFNINVNCVSPGYIPRNGINKVNKSFYEEKTIINKIGRVEDVADLVYFISSEKGDFITGQNFIIDGGNTLGLHGN
jgi:3-oxoacyl-[acyl-carrier protein] reductase